MKGFKDKSGKFRPTENKNGVRMKRGKTTKPSGIQVKSVSLKPTTVHKVNKQIIKDIHAGKSATFSRALNEVVEKARLDRDTSFEDSGKIVGQAKWTSHGRGFGFSYGWLTPDGVFHSMGRRNIPESMLPKGAVRLRDGTMLSLNDGKIFMEDFRGRCNFCGARGFDDRKGCPNNCGKILRDEEGNITGVVGV